MNEEFKSKLVDGFGRHAGQLPPKSATSQFDAAMSQVTQDRGKVYGHPIDTFRRASSGQEIIQDCSDKEIRHALEMIWLKICRMIETPGHLDSAIDIAGYARTICMIIDKRDEDGGM